MSLRVGLLAVVISLAGATVAPAAATAEEAVVFDQVMTWTHDNGESFNGTAVGPSDWVSPVNYKDGTLMFRLEVLSKPSDRDVYAQVCLGQQNWAVESCSRRFDPQFRTTGVYNTDLGAPSSWWSHGAVDWTNVGGSAFPSFALSDPASDRLMQTQGCGAYCWDPAFGDINAHMPITVRATLVAVSVGSSFSGWQNYGGGAPATPPVESPGGPTDTPPVDAPSEGDGDTSPPEPPLDSPTDGDAPPEDPLVDSPADAGDVPPDDSTVVSPSDGTDSAALTEQCRRASSKKKKKPGRGKCSAAAGRATRSP